MAKKPNYEHHAWELQDTAKVLSEAKERDIISYNRWDKANLSGGGGSFCLKNGKEWHPAYLKHPELMKDARTLQQFVDEGYNLKIIGHHGDGKDGWWNNKGAINLTLLELMEIA